MDVFQYIAANGRYCRRRDIYVPTAQPWIAAKNENYCFEKYFA
jgi:hypothetical protein